MDINEIPIKYVNRGGHERKAGRYWASDIYAIRKGYLRPENFFDKQEIDELGCGRILVGQAMEDMLTKMFKTMEVEVEPQQKYLIQITDEITLTVKPDFEFKDKVLETKFPFSEITEIPEKWKDQLEAERRALVDAGKSKDVYLGILKIPFSITTLKYKPSTRRWQTIQDTLKEFHKDVKKVEEQIKLSKQVL